VRPRGGPHNESISPEEFAELRRLYEDEMLGQKAIAERLGYHVSTIDYRIRRAGIRRRSRGEAQRLAYARERDLQRQAG